MPASVSPLLSFPGTIVMGILNVTPDSFSDGNRWLDPTRAIQRGIQMAGEGAAIIDVGGESTRPGAKRVTPEEEWARVGPVIKGLVDRGVTLSVDTVNAETARKALQAGASLINDVSGGAVDPRMVEVVAASGAPMVIQHWRGFPSDPNLNVMYEDVVDQTVEELIAQVDRALAEGLKREQVIIDPGLGFAKEADDSWRIVESLDRFTALGFPVLVGGSRKRFVAARFGDALERGTLNVTKTAVHFGVWGVRVHDVAANVELVDSLLRQRDLGVGSHG